MWCVSVATLQNKKQKQLNFLIKTKQEKGKAEFISTAEIGSHYEYTQQQYRGTKPMSNMLIIFAHKKHLD